MPRVAVVTPVDSSGASGLTAAVESIRALGAEPIPIPTAITGQRLENRTIELRHELTREEVLRLLELNASYKSAFLAVSPISAEELRSYTGIVVVDPVIRTSYGAVLMEPQKVKRISRGATVITPNLREAEALSGREINSWKELEEALEALSELAERVIVKNFNGSDVIRTPHGRIVEIKPRTPAVGYRDLRGSGTLYASTITGLLALGYNVPDAARIAKRLVEISSALSVYTGSKKADPQVYLRQRSIMMETRGRLEEAIRKLHELQRLPALMPEVGSNFGFALPRAHDKDDVYALTGRIVRVKKPPRILVAGEVKLGGSSHIARAIVTMMRFYPELRACMNIRYDPRIVEVLERRFVVSFYERHKEPEEIKKQEGKTIPRGIEEAVKKVPERPDVVYHTGDHGKEPMILIFGEDPADVVEKLSRLLSELEKSERFLNRYRALLRSCTQDCVFLPP